LLKKGVYNVLGTKVLMRKRRSACLIIALLASILALPPYCFSATTPVNAAQRTLSWSIVDTPSNTAGGIIAVGPADNSSGINAIALGLDNNTFYAADTANAKFYKSVDAGVTWYPDIANRLSSAGAFLPVWNLAISPDDSNFILAVTGSATTGPRQVFFSGDGGTNWLNTGLPALGANEFISCLDISSIYGLTNQIRDIAVGTRTAAGNGTIYNIQFNSISMGSWKLQDIPAPLPGNIDSLKFSPNYASDYAIVVISTSATPIPPTNSTARLNLGKHDTTGNTTSWNDPLYGPGYPVPLRITAPSPKVISSVNLIKSHLELPTDFQATTVGQRGCFASLDANNTTAVLYINTELSPNVLDITPPMSPSLPRHISSISYTGSESTGILLAGEGSADPAKGIFNVWQSSNPQASNIGGATWIKSDDIKSPTGGGNSGRANAILNWSSDGTSVYCGSSSENATFGGTGFDPNQPGQWPRSQLTGQLFDESAFSRSTTRGTLWNQISLINTNIDRLSDVAAVEISPEAATLDFTSALYLSSHNENITPGLNVLNNFNSVWRSTSDPLGQRWERILLRRNTGNVGTILRINPRTNNLGQASQTVVAADIGTDNITYSPDQGQSWQLVQAGVVVKDISLASDIKMYVLENLDVRQVNRGDSGWQPGPKLNTNLLGLGHTICTPLKNPGTSDMVMVGSDFQAGSVAWADFSQFIPQFTVLKPLPRLGDIHVIADSHYDQYQYIYAGINVNQTPSTDGIIYRWQLGKSLDWDELDPPNRAFFGLETLNDVLYGAFDFDTTTHNNEGGVDRTLYSRVRVPPPPEWDDLKAGLPQPPTPVVHFTREPTSLKISSNAYNTLWAIDEPNANALSVYDYVNKRGRLWMFIDSEAKLGPWPTNPPTGGLIGADPSSGRGQQIDFKWRPLTDVFGYDLLIAKDVNFTLLLSQVLNLAPVDSNTGAWIVTPADQQQPSVWISPGVLEVGKSYYWRVRGSRALSGETIHSPWSPVMLFSIKPGFIVKTDYPGPTLLTPADGPCATCKPPVRFSWTPIKNATKYEFILSSDPDLKNILTKITTGSTAFEYKDRLELATPYYWQVKAVAPVESDASPVGTFAITNATTVAPPKQAPAKETVTTAQGPPDFWIWVIIVIALVLLMLINLYAFISRRRD
jgi:hypothetical protein